MKSQLLRRRLCAAAVGLATCAAWAAPAGAIPGQDYSQPAQTRIGDTPADFARSVPVSRPGDTPADFPGMLGAPEVPEAVGAPANATGSDGFDWPSAAIGAGGAGLLIVLAAGGVAVTSRGRFRVAR